MRAMGRSSYLLSCVLVTGCAANPPCPGPEIVEVPGPVQYRPIPAGLLTPCTFDDAPSTNGELLESYERLRDLLARCDSQLRAMESLAQETQGDGQ